MKKLLLFSLVFTCFHSFASEKPVTAKYYFKNGAKSTFFELDTSASTPSHSEGVFYWDSTNKTIAMFNDESEVTQQIGQEIYVRVYNDTGTTISNGKVCYLSGIFSNFPTIALAKADAANTCLSTLGFATHDIETGTYGYITRIGTVRDVNTSGCSSGDVLYLSATSAGDYTGTRPESPNYNIVLGNCGVSNATTGTIEVQVNIGSNVVDVIKVFNGSILEDHTTSVSSNGTTVTVSLEQTGGGDLSLFFNGGFSAFDSTPAATVNITAGTDTSPQLNYVYIPQSTGVLTSSTSGWPAAQHVPVGTFLCQSAASVQTYGVYKHHAWTDHLSGSDNQGHVSHINRWIRSQNATWLTGSQLTPTVGLLQFDVATAAGTMLQLHEHATDAFDTATGSDVYMVNDNTTPYKRVGDLTGELTDSEGISLSGRYYSLVFWISGSEGTGNDKLYCNLPSGSYNSSTGAIVDSSGYSTYSIPSDFKGVGILIARVTVRHQTTGGGTWTLQQTDDLRGLIPAQGAGTGGSSTDEDAIHDNVAGEINALTTVTAASSDVVLIEDADDSYNKKKVLASDFISGAGGAPADAQYLTLATDATLTAERLLTPGDGLDGTDAGAGGAYTLSLDLKANGGIVIESTEAAVDLGATSITGTLAITDGGTGQTTNTAAFDALAPSTPSKGDLLVYNGTNWVKQVVGSNDQVLTADSTQASGIKWAAAGGGGTSITLSEKTANYTIVDGDASATIFYYPNSISADYTVTLPTLSANLGDYWNVKNDSSTYTVTIVGEQVGIDAAEASSTSTTINLTAHSFSTGQIIRFTSGSLSGEWRVITSTTPDTVVVTDAFSTAPSTSDAVAVTEPIDRQYQLILGARESKQIYGADATIDQWIVNY